jgi:glucosylceramidase
MTSVPDTRRHKSARTARLRPRRGTLGGSYHRLGQLGRFAQPGRRIASPKFVTYYQTTVARPCNRVTPGLDNIELPNPDGSEVVFAFNAASRSIPFTVRPSRRGFSYVLAPGAAVTFTWDQAE